MVRFNRMLQKDAATGLSKTLSEILQIKDGIPCLVPKDGKILDDDDTVSEDTTSDPTVAKEK